jgi:hypothetical protein
MAQRVSIVILFFMDFPLPLSTRHPTLDTRALSLDHRIRYRD